MPAPAGSYNLSTVLRALGIRDPRVIPTLAGEGQIVPTVSFGALETLVPEVIEARAVFAIRNAAVPSNNWRAWSMQSVAPGGTIIEQLVVENDIPDAVSPPFILNLAPVQPFVPLGAITPWSFGGQTLANIYFRSAVSTPNPAPIGASLGGTSTNNMVSADVTGGWPTTASAFGSLWSRIWVPPSWWFWLVQIGDGANAIRFGWRTREIPQPQGAA